MPDGKTILREKLDECLLAHFDALKEKEQVSIGDLYQLEGYCEIHYFMKVEHEYERADIEALLQFKDPLTVAWEAKSENPYAYTFPVAEILEKMNARDIFDLAEKPVKQEKQSASLRDKLQASVKELKEKPAPDAPPRDDGAR